ncbi:MAG: hypothetical protein J6A75_02455 [Lachnospiraceae bacterium]|nr:hypothetical protein [Lachnospiraceae bacterium]
MNKKEGAGEITGFSYEKDFIKSEATHYLLGGTLPGARYENIGKMILHHYLLSNKFS